MQKMNQTSKPRSRSSRPDGRSVLARLRGLSPARGLDTAEALGIAERQATALLRITGTSDGPVPLSILSQLPRIRLEIETELPSSGMSYWDGTDWRLVRPSLRALQPAALQPDARVQARH